MSKLESEFTTKEYCILSNALNQCIPNQFGAENPNLMTQIEES